MKKPAEVICGFFVGATSESRALERNIIIKAVEIRSWLRCRLLRRWCGARLLRCGRLLRARSLLTWGRLLVIVATTTLWRALVALWTATQQLHGALHVDDNMTLLTPRAITFS